ncbi:MAG: hypothetical protein ACI399_05845 [Candidatus Cryptobacteroides sp.]
MKRTLLSLSLLALTAFAAGSQPKPGFVYDIGFCYCFDNREFDAGAEAFSDSKTIHAARLTPSLGISIPVSGAVTHSLMTGIDIVKDMGASPTSEDMQSSVNIGLFREMTLWYGISARLPEISYRGCVGIFPRKYSVFGCSDNSAGDIPGRNIPSLFLSDSYRFYDSNIEGLLFSASRKRAYYEVSLDWLGMFGSYRREQFIVQSYGKGGVCSWADAGWVASLHHFANSMECTGVIDDVTLSPFVSFNLNRVLDAGLDRLSLTIHYIQGIHQDRRNSTGLEYAYGGQAELSAMKWNLGVKNEIYYGMGQMPYYDLTGPDGEMYGSSLYRGNPFYRISPEGDWKATGIYDRLEIFYQPTIAGFLNLRLSACLHFTGKGFEGWQQRFVLFVNLDNHRVKK